MELVVTYKGEEKALHIHDKDIISFPSGLVGFQEWRRFVLLDDPEEAPLAVLQCVDDTDVSFLVTDPRHIFSDYKLELPLEEADQLGIESAEDGRVLCILTVKDGPVRVTANLLGPVVINTRTMIARQVILQDSQYSAQHPVLVAQAE
ncbi:MAG: flagellar assembly protein FliW [Dehalococcoidales bacterium]|nr:flagellar assembly protein FliW [Dehalococcoidales bacterium]